MPLRHVGDHHVQPRPLGQRRIDERRRQVDAASGRLQHALDEVAHFAVGQRDRSEFGHAVARDEDAVRAVDPDLFDLGIVEERLQGAETGERRDDLPGRDRLVDEQRHRPTESPLAVPPHGVADVAAGELPVGAQIDAVASNALAHLVGDDRLGVRHAEHCVRMPRFAREFSTGAVSPRAAPASRGRRGRRRFRSGAPRAAARSPARRRSRGRVAVRRPLR